MTTETKARRRPAAKKSRAKVTSAKQTKATGAKQTNKIQNGIDEFGISFFKAAAQGWYYFLPGVFGLVIGGLVAVAAPAAGLAIFLVLTALSGFMFYTTFKSQLMPVMILEHNSEKDKLQLRVYYALKSEFGAEGRFDVLGKPGYCVDSRETTGPLAAFKTEDDYNYTTPESLRYMCEHSASSEAYRRQSSTLKRDIVNWTAVLILVGLFGFFTFTIGSNVLGEG